jgi:hypothetical protein
MRDNRFTITIPRETWAAILDAIQHAIVDKYAAKANRCGSGGRRYVDKLASQRRKGRRPWHVPRRFMG